MSYGWSGRVTDEERSSLDRILAFVARRPDCFERSLLEGHVTGSAWILAHDRSACLLTHHKKLGLWLQCGGHADGDPDVLGVALREAREESGIAGIEPASTDVFDVDVHSIPAREDEPEHFHYDVRFVLIAPPRAEAVVSSESHALAWVRPEEIERYATDRSVRRMSEKWSITAARGRSPGSASS
jgi:8-oxo-dGTP pyrophosphatase MutT (NUDIX family)